MSLTIDEIINLNNKVHEICGWNGASILEMGYSVSEEGDLWLYVEIYYDVLGGDLIKSTRGLYLKLREACGDLAKNIKIHQDESEDSSSGYFVAIELDKGANNE